MDDLAYRGRELAHSVPQASETLDAMADHIEAQASDISVLRTNLSMKTQQMADLAEALTGANKACEEIAQQRDSLRAQISRMIDPEALLRWNNGDCAIDLGGFGRVMAGQVRFDGQSFAWMLSTDEHWNTGWSKNEAYTCCEKAILVALGIPDNTPSDGENSLILRGCTPEPLGGIRSSVSSAKYDCAGDGKLTIGDA